MQNDAVISVLREEIVSSTCLAGCDFHFIDDVNATRLNMHGEHIFVFTMDIVHR